MGSDPGVRSKGQVRGSGHGVRPRGQVRGSGPGVRSRGQVKCREFDVKNPLASEGVFIGIRFG